jgi:hypothetical protein
MTVREVVYALSSTDAELMALGLTEETVWAAGAPDSPKGKLFMVLNWADEEPGLPNMRGRNRPTSRDVEAWFYTRDRNSDELNLAIRRWRELMDALEDVPTESGRITSTRWRGDGRDTWDDIYEATFRTSTYTIIANGD